MERRPPILICLAAMPARRRRSDRNAVRPHAGHPGEGRDPLVRSRGGWRVGLGFCRDDGDVWPSALV